MKVLVTGGAGFLGSRIVQRLLARGDEVTVLSRNADKIRTQGSGLGSSELAKVRTINADLRDFVAVGDAIEGHDAVFHVAAKAGVFGSRREYFSVNVRGTLNVMASCGATGVKSLIYTSTPSVVFERGGIEGGDESLPYPRKFLSHYAHSKACAESLVLTANGIDGLRTVALRPHLIWGSGDPHLLPRVFDSARAGKLKQVGVGSNKVDITHVNDAADAHILALDNIERAAGKAYFIRSETVPLWRWINGVLKRAGLPMVSEKVSHATAYKAGAVQEFIWRALHLRGEPPMTRFVAENLATSHWFSIEAARRDLSYQPQWTGEPALDEFFERPVRKDRVIAVQHEDAK